MGNVTTGMKLRKALRYASSIGLLVRTVRRSDAGRVTDRTVKPVDTVLFDTTRKDCPRALTSLLKRAERRRAGASVSVLEEMCDALDQCDGQIDEATE
ncbi:MAG: hypothetical protein COA96_17060 [SAR86 cluster bacterium]|uniref:Uncharacterized protein n=1 Tax=SAR86 cluster bacterium TaxID=2030880 RepID=A0A2A5AHT4_9GAMM|nr:MAG: hypothetical protein COA96_17060 [SAR86 cluster bacterium]